jgi:decaprenylphospho-beta-D-erythro-pentofuranosid-2-ulose 2-reductase
MVQNAFGEPQNVDVLGGTSDIARAIVQRLCSARARSVVLCGRDETRLRVAAVDAERQGATRVETVLFDAEEPLGAGETVRAAFEAMHDRVDLVVVAVGLLGHQVRDEDDAGAAARLVTVNFTWPAAALAEVRRLLVAQGSGRILVISSIAAVRPRRSAYLYASAKAGLDAMCVGLADSLVATGVTLQILRPGVVRTKMSRGLRERPFTTDPSDVAEFVMRALATNDLVIWSPPTLRYVALAIRFVPRGLWRRLDDAMER